MIGGKLKQDLFGTFMGVKRKKKKVVVNRLINDGRVKVAISRVFE